MSRARFFIFIGIFFALAGQASASLKAAATFLPVYIFAKNIAGDKVEVSLLVPPGTDVHEFSLRPLDKKRLEDADLIIANGAGLEGGLLRGIDSRKIVDASRGIEIIGKDPHVWLDPLLAARQVENIRDALSLRDAANAEFYGRNAEIYINKLKELHAGINRALAGLKTKYLITHHEAFMYFGERYGLIAYSLTGPDAETPLPERIKTVYDILRRQGVKAVFAEEQFPAGQLESIRRGTGAGICKLNSIESGRPEAGFYEEAMRKNLKTIIECLGK